MTEIEKLLKAYDKMVLQGDDFGMTMIYTRMLNLGYNLVEDVKQ